MDFEIALSNLAEKIKNTKDKILTEEATKTSYILPFLNILGYDVFDPTIVVPEFTADIGRKKNEKVDYAIMVNDKPLILIEAKSHTETLDRHKTQLERYFTVTESKFAVLTNGIEYRFYSDLEKPNIMDKSPFLTINLLNLKDRDIKELEKFKAENFNIENILSMAGRKKYINGIKNILKGEMQNPSDDFIRIFAGKLTNKPLRQQVIEEFRGYVKQALNETINDLVNDKINALKEKLNNENSPENIEEINEYSKQNKDNGIVTTEEELEGYYIVKSIFAKVIDLNRIAQRDTKSYFGILLDDNNRKWLVRLHFNYSNKYIEIRTGEKESEKFLLNTLNDIYNYEDMILNTLKVVEEK
jgi:hypothetical protein